MKRIINSNYFYAFIALCGALWLFFFVSSPGVGSTRDTNQSNTSTVTKKATLTVPLQLQADVDKYYITGYPQNVKVTIEGPAALVTATKNTQNFNLFLNLKDLSIGQHRVQIKESGLNSELTYSIKPKYVTVNIQKRETRKFAVDVEYNKESLATGYEAGKTEVSPDTVTVTGAASEIEKINRVIVKPILPKGIKSTFDQEVLVQALDKNGKTVNVTLNPQTVHVKIPITIQSKQVSINLKQSGNSSNSNNTNFTFESDVKSIRIFGTQSQMDAINNSIDIPVDITDVTGNTKKSINLGDALGNKVAFTDPDSIDVTISTGSSSSSSNSSNNSSGSSNSNNSNGGTNANNNDSDGADSTDSSNTNSTNDNNNSEE